MNSSLHSFGKETPFQHTLDISVGVNCQRDDSRVISQIVFSLSTIHYPFSISHHLVYTKKRLICIDQTEKSYEKVQLVMF